MSSVLAPLILRAKATAGAVRQDSGTLVCHDLGRLLPGFREQIEAVLSDMRLAGHNPRVYETWRSPGRVALLVARGTGSAHSMHMYGAAADIIDAELLWGAKAAFWVDLCKFAEARGLTAGARFKSRHDLPHIQAIPVWAQPKLVGAGALLGISAAVDAERDKYAAQFYRPPSAAMA